MRAALLAFAFLSGVSVLPALAEEAAVPGRFSFERVRDGFVRLDRESGQVAWCAAKDPAAPDTGWSCTIASDRQAALEQDVTQLRAEVASLRQQMAKRDTPEAPPRPPADLTPDASTAPVVRLPTQEDIDRAGAVVQRAWDRLVDMVGNLKRDLTRKTQRESAPDRGTAL